MSIEYDDFDDAAELKAAMELVAGQRIAAKENERRKLECFVLSILNDQERETDKLATKIGNAESPLFRKAKALSKVAEHMNDTARRVLAAACHKQGQRWLTLANQFEESGHEPA